MSVPGLHATDFSGQRLESLRGRKDAEAIKAAAREMESLFAYEMIKAMRAASGTSAAGTNGLGGEMYGSLFDMELGRLMASRGLGLQEMIMRGMEKVSHPGQDAKKESEDADAPSLSEVPSDSPKRFAFFPPARTGNATGSKDSASGVPDTVPPVVSAAVEVKPAAPVENARLSSPGFAPRIPNMPDMPRKTGPIPYGEWLPPIREEGRISSSYGYRKDPFAGTQKFHYGVDIAAAHGAKIYPVKNGEVTFSGYRKGYGNIVEISHGNGVVTRYAHNRSNLVAVGDQVSPNTIIAEVGSTGRSTGPHLHFEVRRDGQKVPPQMIFSGFLKEGANHPISNA
ncbi:MAG: peptidoglycan DD-metalloendopeptidase family protein [Syntrophorhabdaceae bacterium]|nr:peptidoglycan DD-metalloendopeptidase family protein [Syntrophorhabdaceae bacterium]